MSLDKSWMKITNRACLQYYKGVTDFLDFAYSDPKRSDDGMIKCPCVRCNNTLRGTREDVKGHLVMYGIAQCYTTWRCHGEVDASSYLEDLIMDDGYYEDDDDADIDEEMVDDMYNLINDVHGKKVEDVTHSNPEDPNPDARQFFELLKDAQDELYPGCPGLSRLSFIITLLHLKSKSKWTNSSFTELLQFMQKVFPQVKNLPGSYYECQKYIKCFGLHYEKIHACVNDCVLFRKEHKDLDKCPICTAPRWTTIGGDDEENQKRIPQKVLRYFPLIPRLKRLFLNPDTAKDMRWHSEGRRKDGILRHPGDTRHWKEFNISHPDFAAEHRNVRLGLAADGFSPFGNMNNPYSTWPIVLMPYNLPPWLCMKEPFLFLTMLIPGPKAPGNDIDVYLEPLIDELKQLWHDGVETYDASLKHNFNMKAAVIWTVNDFPAYGNLSGWGTKGKMACPVCHKNTSFLRLKFGRKTCYMGHRRFLRKGHRWRSQYMVTPKRLTGKEIVDQLTKLGSFQFGKHANDKYPGYLETHNWRKPSIFFQLPYWESLLLRHNLDPMHIEKNCFDNLFGTIMGIKGKCKDSEKIRKDLEHLKIRKRLWLKMMKSGKLKMPQAEYSLNAAAKKQLCDWLKALKCPDGYVSNISKCIKDQKFSGLKSHDCHVLMEQFMPLVLHDLLPTNVANVVVAFCNFFRYLCKKSLDVAELDKLQEEISDTLSKLECIFLPAFFDVMIHLTVHLAEEAKIAGPVQYRWMYPVERYLGKLKSYVRNKARPEGSIAEGYIADECLTFCSRYLKGVKTKFNIEERNFDGNEWHGNGELSVFEQSGRVMGGVRERELSYAELEMAQFYVLENCDELQEDIGKHKTLLTNSGIRNVEAVHKQRFVKWFREKATSEYDNPESTSVQQEILSVARGPVIHSVRCFSGFYLNGYRFHTLSREKNLKTQNSGVRVRGDPNYCDVEYLGQLLEIVELRYIGGHSVILFRCHWFDVLNRAGVKIKRGEKMVNVNRSLQGDGPFILASQAEQVFYVPSLGEPGWLYVKDHKPRNLFDMPTLDRHMARQGDAYQEDYEKLNDDNIQPEADDDDLPGEFIDDILINLAHEPQDVASESSDEAHFEKSDFSDDEDAANDIDEDIDTEII